jgi:hypothetical protein
MRSRLCINAGTGDIESSSMLFKDNIREVIIDFLPGLE